MEFLLHCSTFHLEIYVNLKLLNLLVNQAIKEELHLSHFRI